LSENRLSISLGDLCGPTYAAPAASNAKRFDRRVEPVRLGAVLLNIVKIFSIFFLVIGLSASPQSFAAEQASDIPLG
jgi:hypothetical protein